MYIRPLRFLLPLVALVAAAPLFSQEENEVTLSGTVDQNNIYTSPGGHYRMPIPVLPELGGAVEDSSTVADFRDGYGTHVLVATLPMEPALRARLDTSNKKDFLTWFYGQQIQAEYQRSYPGAKTEAARFIPALQDGTLFITILLPQGSAFRDVLFLNEGEAEPDAKRGSLIFIKNDRIFMLTTELYERILKRDTFKKTAEEEDAILRQRLMDLLGKMTFPSTTPAR
jgi:hypothetical protein